MAMRLRIVFACCAALALTVGVATATAGGGNSDAAKKCQTGGWNNWVRADQSAFKNEGDCVSYAAKGGVLTAAKTKSQVDCESFGGTFAAGTPSTLWTCNGWQHVGHADFLDKSSTLSADCTGDGGSSSSTDNAPAGVADTICTEL